MLTVKLLELPGLRLPELSIKLASSRIWYKFLREYWGIGIGSALTEACIKCAKEAGYIQLELNVVADNTRLIFYIKEWDS